MKKIFAIYILLGFLGCNNPVNPVNSELNTVGPVNSELNTVQTMQLEYKVLASAVSDSGRDIILANFGNGIVEQRIDSVVYHEYSIAGVDLKKPSNYYMIYWTFNVNDIEGDTALFQIYQTISPGENFKLGVVTYYK